jgi:beta-glucosidase/6-phospho-beta-glucosidase/beta-galactosidase
VSFDIFGANFYPWSYGEMHQSPNGTIRPLPKVADGTAIKQILKDAYLHSGLPVMVTETSANAPVAERKRWMEETISAVKSLRTEGIPVLGYTWFPLFTMIDWAYRRGRKPLKDYLLHLGMYDSSFNEEGVLERRPTKLVTCFQNLQHEEMPSVGAAGT